MENAGASVTRYETTLSEALTATAGSYLRESASAIFGETENKILSVIPDGVFAGLAAELICDCGMLSESPVGRYSDGMLDMLYSDVCVQGRILYLRFAVTIPAQGEITVTAEQTRPASRDFIGENKARNGYDMVTELGSTLRFTAQTASLSHTEQIGIPDQSFGFDLTNGITEVILDPAQEHYRLEVQKIPAD